MRAERSKGRRSTRFVSAPPNCPRSKKMIRNATLSCRCGEVRGLVTRVSPNTVNRVVCYCDDCQAFLHHLGRAELLDAQGGTDIVQIAPGSLSFIQGKERLAGLDRKSTRLNS